VTAAKPSVGRVAAAAAAKKNVDVLRNTFSVRVRVVLTKKKEKKTSCSVELVGEQTQNANRRCNGSR
jgi:hypothetical protein